MNWRNHPNTDRPGADSGFGIVPWLVIFGGLAVLIVLGLWLTRPGHREPVPAEPKGPGERVVAKSSHPQTQDAFPPVALSADVFEQTAGAGSDATVQAPAKSVSSASEPSIFPRTEATPHARQLVGELANLPLAHGVVTANQAAQWKQRLQELAALGEGAVPAIREFLEMNLDLEFAGVENEALLGHRTLRTALLSVLLQTEGLEALGVALQTLQTTADPTEIGMLAKYLTSAETPEYRDAVLTATREALALAATAHWDGRDVGPLLDILKHLGGVEAAGALAGYANTWFNYVPLTLADLPDGAGIPSLIQLAENADGKLQFGQDLYQRMLAQTAIQYPEAAEALLRQVQGNRLRASAWPGIAAALTGNTVQIQVAPLTQPTEGLPPGAVKSFHVAVGNQNYVEVPPVGGLSGEQIQQRIQLIDQLLGSTGDAVATAHLQRARAELTERPSGAGS